VFFLERLFPRMSPAGHRNPAFPGILENLTFYPGGFKEGGQAYLSDTFIAKE
jgi:hypothetical protein